MFIYIVFCIRTSFLSKAQCVCDVSTVLSSVDVALTDLANCGESMRCNETYPE